MNKKSEDKTMFVLDTNVPVHDPASFFHFEEHDIYIPMIVPEELDGLKKGVTEVARNARQASRFLLDLIEGVDLPALKEGIPLSQLSSSGTLAEKCSGRLFFQAQDLKLCDLPEGFFPSKNDNTILKVTIALQKEYPAKKVVLVSKDLNVRIKAAALGLQAEDYLNDTVIDDLGLLYSGMIKLPRGFWKTHLKNTGGDSWKDKEGRIFYKVKGPLVKKWYPNQFLYLPGDPELQLIVRTIENKSTAILEVARDFCTAHNDVWGITAQNREQNFALNVLLDPEIDFVTMLGPHGTGKTLLAIASALVQIFDKKIYTKITFTRETVPLGEKIGFTKGNEDEKMEVWTGALADNIEFLCSKYNDKTRGESESWEQQDAAIAFIARKIEVKSISFMRGRTFIGRVFIIDEAQNLTVKQADALISRAGPGTKVICMGNLKQIDTPYLSPTTSGLTYLVEYFKDWSHSAHIILTKGKRSRLANYINEKS